MTEKSFFAAHLRSLFLALSCVLILTGNAYPSSKDVCYNDADAWCPQSAGPIVTWTAPVCEKNKLSVQPFFYFNRTRGVFDKDSNYKAYTGKDRKWQWQEQLYMQYGLTERWELDVQGTYQQNIRQIAGASAESAGFADSYIYSSYCLAEEKGWMPCVAAWFTLKLPTGKYQKANPSRLGTDLNGATSGGGSYDHGYGFVLTKKIKPFVLHADAIWNIPILTKVDGVKTKYDTYAKYDLGLEYFFHKGFNLMLELNGFWQGDRREDNVRVADSKVRSLIISPGFGWSNDKIQTLFAYQRTIAGTNVDVNDCFVLTFVCTF